VTVDGNPEVKAIADYQQASQTVFDGATTIDNSEKAIVAREPIQISH